MAGRPLHAFEVVATRHLAPHMVRVVLGGSGFDTFVPSDFTDSYIKLVFVDDDVDVGRLPRPLTLDSFADLPTAKRPPVRTMTVRHVDAAAREIAVDIVLHGEHGVAGPWAAGAQRGQPIYLMGPGGAYAPDPAADWHLLAGDESAIPAIAAALEALPPDAIGRAFIEVAGPDDEIGLTAPDAVEVNWVYRGGRADLVPEDRAGDHAPLIEAVTTTAWLPGRSTSLFTVRRKPSCITCGHTFATSAVWMPNGRRRSPVTGGADAPRRCSANGRKNWLRRRPGLTRSAIPGRKISPRTRCGASTRARDVMPATVGECRRSLTSSTNTLPCNAVGRCTPVVPTWAI